MAKIDHIDRRLLNWARWRAKMNGGGGNYATIDITQPVVDRSGWDAETPITVDDAEASLTDTAVHQLEPDLQRAIAACYLGSGSPEQHAKRLCVPVATIYARRDRAHQVLARWFAEREATAEAERQRVECLQAIAARQRVERLQARAAPERHDAAPPTGAPHSELAEHLARTRAARAAAGER